MDDKTGEAIEAHAQKIAASLPEPDEATITRVAVRMAPGLAAIDAKLEQDGSSGPVAPAARPKSPARPRVKTSEQAIQELVADWPDPTPEQRDRLRELLMTARAEAQARGGALPREVDPARQ